MTRGRLGKRERQAEQLPKKRVRAASAGLTGAKKPLKAIPVGGRRVAREHQQHSKLWKDVDLRTLSGQALRNATQQIYADSIAASSAPEKLS